MQVHVLVRVHMIEFEAGRGKGRELGADLGREPSPHSRHEKKSQRRAQLIAVEFAGLGYQVSEFCGRHYRNAIDQHEMEPDLQPGKALCPRHGVGGGRRRHHQAGAGQDAVAVCLFDRLVDRDITPEIIRADNQAPACGPGQLAISRWRRNWKNSTPSRSRRRIISGLRNISPSRDAIFVRRK